MSTTWRILSPMRFNSSWGNWEPEETESMLVCDYCQANNDDFDFDENNEVYAIPWKEDAHFCPDCINDFLSDYFEDNFNEETGLCVCPICKAEITKDDFIQHVKDELIFGGI